MGQRILSGLRWLVTLAALVAAGVVLWQQSALLTEIDAQRVADSQWRQSLSTTLNNLRSRLPAPVPEESMAKTNDSNMMQRMQGEAMGDGFSGPMTPGMSGGAMGGLMPSATQETLDLPAVAGSIPSLTIKLVQEKADGPPVTDAVQAITLTGAGETRFPRSPGVAPATQA